MAVNKTDKLTITFNSNQGQRQEIKVKRYRTLLGVVQWLRGDAIYLKGEGFLSIKSIFESITGDSFITSSNLKSLKKRHFSRKPLQNNEKLQKKCQQIWEDRFSSVEMKAVGTAGIEMEPISKSRVEDEAATLRKEELGKKKSALEEEKEKLEKNLAKAPSLYYQTHIYERRDLFHRKWEALKDEAFHSDNDRDVAGVKAEKKTKEQDRLWEEQFYIRQLKSNLSEVDLDTIKGFLLTKEELKKLFSDPEELKEEVKLREGFRQALKLEKEVSTYKPFESVDKFSEWRKNQAGCLERLRNELQRVDGKINERKDALQNSGARKNELEKELTLQRSELRSKEQELENLPLLRMFKQGPIKEEIKSIQRIIENKQGEISEIETKMESDQKLIRELPNVSLIGGIEKEEIENIMRIYSTYLKDSNRLKEVDTALKQLNEEIGE